MLALARKTKQRQFSSVTSLCRRLKCRVLGRVQSGRSDLNWT